MFGGNSNWRGPIWFPLNYLVVNALERYHRFFGDELTIEYPTGSGQLALARRRRRRPAPAADRPLRAGPGRAAAVLRAASSGCSATRPGATTSSSTSTSTATTAPGSVRRTRRAGPGSSPTSSGAGRGNGVYTLGERDAARRGAGLVVSAVETTSLHVRPGRRFPLGATPCRAGHQLRGRVERRRRDRPVPVRRRGSRDAGRRWRTTTPASGTASSTASARARPTASARWARSTRARGIRCNPAKLLLDPYARATTGAVTFGPEVLGHDAGRLPDRPSTLDSAATCPRASSSTRRSTGPTPATAPHRYADSIIYEVHVKGFTMRHPGVPPELRGTYAGLGARGGHRPPRRPRRHGRRAAARAPERARGVPRAAGPDELLGLQHDRLLRPPRRLLGRGPRRPPRRPGGRVQGDGRRPARRRPRGHARRGLQPHRRERPHRADVVPPRRSTTPPTTGSTPTTCAATSTRPAAATR